MDLSVDSITCIAKNNSTNVSCYSYRYKCLNGRVTDTKNPNHFKVESNVSWISGLMNPQTRQHAIINCQNNTTTSSRQGIITITPQLADTTAYPIEGEIPSKTIVVTQEAGEKIYGDITASLSYSTDTDAIGGTCSPTLSYSQTYT